MSHSAWAPSTSQRQKLAAWCVRGVDLGILLCLFATPLWFGGRHDLGRLLYAVSVATTTVAWSARCLLLKKTGVRRSVAHVLVLAAIGLVTLQMAPLSAGWLNGASPALSELAPTWSSATDSELQLGQWRMLSVTPSATAVGLAVLISHGLLFFVVVERLRDEQDVRKLLYAIGAASAAMAAFGLIQWLTSNGKLMWFYSHPSREIGSAVQGSFANKNHFAQFVVLGLGPAVMAWWAVAMTKRKKKSKRSDWRQPLARGLWSAAVAVALAAMILSLSRGGLIALTAATVIGGGALFAKGMLARGHAWAIGAFVALALMIVSFGDTNMIFNRYDDLASGSLESLDNGNGRRSIWSANLAATQANPWFGYGVGSHAHVYTAFIAPGFTTEFTHAESGYLHTLTETGLAGGVLLLAMLLTVGRWCYVGLHRETDPQRIATWAAIAAGLAATVVHSVVDFVWYIPACMSVVVLLAACALRLKQLTSTNDRTASKTKALGWAPALATPMLAVVAVSALWAPGSASLAWDRYLRASVAERKLLASSLGGSDDEAESVRSRVAFLKQQMIAALEEVVAKHPGHARAHLRLAGRRLQQFQLEQQGADNAMGLTHIRDAAFSSAFPSREATADWLRAAFGDKARHLVEAHKHSLAALRLAPLQADGYGYLANLNFLSRPSERNVRALMDQAMTISPHDGGTLYEAGRQALLAGESERAFELWKRAHQIPGTHRTQIIALLAGQVPAEVYLAEFEPDWRALWGIYLCYRQLDEPEDLRAIAAYSARLGGTPAQDRHEARRSELAWRLASTIMRDLGECDAAVTYAEQAFKTPGSDFGTRACLALAYAEADRLQDAAPHLRWCLSRRPDHQRLQKWLKQAQKERLQASAASRPLTK